jgi:hypothetical protein
MSAADRASWTAGPLTLLSLPTSWKPVQLEVNRLVRCSGAHGVDIAVGPEGSELVWASGTRLPIWAAVQDADGQVTLLAPGSRGAPSVVAQMRPDEELARMGEQGWIWVDRTGQVVLPTTSWLPADRADELPEGTACRLR